MQENTRRHKMNGELHGIAATLWKIIPLAQEKFAWWVSGFGGYLTKTALVAAMRIPFKRLR